MNDEEFDALIKPRPFGTEDATRWDAQIRGDFGLCMTLGAALWGRTSEDLRRQLLASHPEIPPGVGLGDLRKLLQVSAQAASAVLLTQRLRGLAPGVGASPAVTVGTQSFNLWEARHEIVRRAIDYLETR
jgi:hypothetical protein